jgi:beta-glucosidase/6-phospho-beta-glucosidase/beta-galactosidase
MYRGEKNLAFFLTWNQIIIFTAEENTCFTLIYAKKAHGIHVHALDAHIMNAHAANAHIMHTTSDTPILCMTTPMPNKFHVYIKSRQHANYCLKGLSHQFEFG